MLKSETESEKSKRGYLDKFVVVDELAWWGLFMQ